MRCARASASDVSWFSREVQDFLAAGASFSRRPDGLNKMRVKIVFKNHILLEFSRTSLNLVIRFFAALNLLMGPGLVGSALLISSEDIAVHLSRGICVTH